MTGFRVEAKNISQRYTGVKILDNVSISLEPRQVTGVMGVNGAGKSSLLRIIGLIEKPDIGQLFIDGENPNQNIKNIRHQIGYAPQDIALFNELSAYDNLLFYSIKNKKQAKNKLDELVCAFDMESFIKKRVYKLSGGMKRRVNLAVALINSPKLLVADEPFVGLDADQRKKVLNYLNSLSKQGMTQIISSHYSENLSVIAHNIIHLDNGRIIS